MAKISARGDRERERWRRQEDGAEVVHTVNGRMLVKAAKGHPWTYVGKRTQSQFALDAAQRGMERV